MHILLTALLLPIVIIRPIEDFMKLGGPTRVIAHRGFSGAAPENTLAAFEKAIEVGADMFELDVLLSRDGRVVVIHDDTLDRTTDGEGKVAAFTLAELKKLDAGSWFSAEFAGERIPTLEEALRLAKGCILVNVEIKTEAVGRGVVAKALEVIDELDMKDNVVISSFDPTALAKARELHPGIRTASLFDAELQKGMSPEAVLFFTLNHEDFSFVIHLDRQPRTSRRREAQTGSRARSGSRSERTLDAVEHSRTLMEWWPFLIFHRGGLRIKVINNKRSWPKWARTDSISADAKSMPAS